MTSTTKTPTTKSSRSRLIQAWLVLACLLLMPAMASAKMACGTITKVHMDPERAEAKGRFLSFYLDQAGDPKPGDKFTRANGNRPGIDGWGSLTTDNFLHERIGEAVMDAYLNERRVCVHWTRDTGSDGYGWYPELAGFDLE